MLDNTYPQKDPKKGARLSGGGPTKPANGNKRPADSTPDPNLKKRRKDADLMPAPSVPVTPATKPDRPTDLSSLPTSSLISYLVKHDVLPPVLPSPYTSQPSLAPTSLLDPASTDTPILTDLDAVHSALAKLAERHWANKTRAREQSLLAASSGRWYASSAFMWATHSPAD
ncbi:unnamed protein product [Rhizoctonia solani]|uniref:Uncharacterized protein n=1 Tax=Rhizoctonia solani TaxID=456999 RepID=A0A8H3CQQ3_9AGAM|nr:unnamed protein product [Rhizoctonia solani]